jgi:hypothetical protein
VSVAGVKYTPRRFEPANFAVSNDVSLQAEQKHCVGPFGASLARSLTAFTRGQHTITPHSVHSTHAPIVLGDAHYAAFGAVILPRPLTSSVSDSLDSLLATADVADRRDEVVAGVREHAGRIARELALLQGGDYGSRDFDTDSGTWTVKYEGGALQYLRYDGGREDVYVVSAHSPPDPEALAEALRDYAAFVEAYNACVESLEGVLDDVNTDFPAVASTESVAAERDRVLDRIRAVSGEMAGQLHRAEGTDYGTFSARVDGTRWELKRERDQVSYLRVGGEGGIYLLSQYGNPPATDVRELVGSVPAFVEAFNERVDDLDAGLSRVEL